MSTILDVLVSAADMVVDTKKELVASVDVPVFMVTRGKMFRTCDVIPMYGIATGYDHPFYIRTTMDISRGELTIDRIGKYIAVVAAKIAQLSKGMSLLCPTHNSRVRRIFVNGKSVLEMELLFARNGEEASTTSVDFSRQCSTNHHENDKSYVLGTAVVAIINDGSFFAEKFDGYSIGRKSCFNVDSEIAKIDLWGDRETALINPQNYLKGLIRFVDDKYFNRLCEIHGLSAEEANTINVLAPVCSMKYFDGAELISSELVSIMDNICSNHATLGIQAIERVPLTPWGEEVVFATWKEQINRIFSALEDKTGSKVAELLISIMGDINSKYDDEPFEEEDLDLIDEKVFATLKKTMRVLSISAPQDNSAYINSVLGTLLRNFLKHIRIPGGLTTFAVPANIAKHTITIPKWYAKKQGISKHDKVTIYRYPNTGIEMAEVEVIGFTNSIVEINPDFWSDRFCGDFDGDLIGILPISGIVDESRIRDSLSTKAKAKAKVSMANAIARCFFAKIQIPFFDSLMTMAYENNGNVSKAAEYLQACVDSIKHAVDVPSEIDAIEGVLGVMVEGCIPSTSAIAKILRGRLAEKVPNGRDMVAITYNNLVSQLQYSETSLMGRLSKYIPYVLFPNRKYVDAVKSADNSTRMENMVNTYRTILSTTRPELINIKSNFEKGSMFPDSIIKKYRSAILKDCQRIEAAHPEAVKAANTVFTCYQEWIKAIGSGDPNAYDYIEEARKIIEENETVGAIAMRYLFSVLGFQLKRGNITYKAITALYYLPFKIGNYCLATYLQKLGIRYNYDVEVIYPFK